MTGIPIKTTAPLSYAVVALNRPFAFPYTYYIPESLAQTIRIGSLVEVPLRAEKARGVVLDLLNSPETNVPIKPILAQLTPDYAIEPYLIQFAKWMANYYCCSHGEMLETVSMIGLNQVAERTESRFSLTQPEVWLTKQLSGEQDSLTPKQIHLIKVLLAEGNQPQSTHSLKEKGVGSHVLKKLIADKHIIRTKALLEPNESDETYREVVTFSHDIKLTQAQKEAFGSIHTAMQDSDYHSFLLYGVTGSGKTEIYLHSIETALQMGRTALVLAPEIALTPQMISVFRQRFGSQIGLYHSKLSLLQKYRLWHKIISHQVRIVIGARSALFLPLPNLGVIVVDEEHESVYKQSESPRYNARDMALVRGTQQNAVVILGSATPSVESLHNAHLGKHTLLRLPERIGPHSLPPMVVIDMKELLLAGKNETLLDDSVANLLISPQLRQAIALRLERHEQTILLLNRRGFAAQLFCLACERAIFCHHCDIPMTYHKAGDKLCCHWCGAIREVPTLCPNCNSSELYKLGLGTQRIEQVLHQLFPQARALRVDTDAMRRQGAFETAWREIVSGNVDIILGTQMIAKGLHLEKVTLVGILYADSALMFPDFRSGERTYALLTQVAGRAGRGELAGEVFVQSYQPHHYAIDTAVRHSEKEFYDQELKYRRFLQFPPFSKLASILLSGTNERLVQEHAEKLASMLKMQVYHKKVVDQVHILGATAAPFAKINDEYRWRLLLRSGSWKALQLVIHAGLHEFRQNIPKKSATTIIVDIDAQDFF